MAHVVDNASLRSVVEAFAAAPGQETYFDVLRASLQGELLLDATGSTITFTEDGSSIAAGSTIRFHEGVDPNGGRALFAFTSQQRAGDMHADDRDGVQTIGQSALGVLEFAVAQGFASLYIDPAGPTCSLDVTHVQFVLRNEHNDAVKDALATDDRTAVLEALASGGSLLFAVSEHADGRVEVATSMNPDGTPVYLAFTSAAEVLARDTDAAVAAVDLHRIVSDAITAPFGGLVINPSGPWIALTVDELRALLERLPEPPAEASTP